MKSPCSHPVNPAGEQGLAFINFTLLLLHANGMGFE